ncbi:hypothetical protein TREPR_0751 [Treponema primitia ZAS-2]|uniref:Uncharacterized protein n=1 Tax=Treponema primitia (strain ATCC BAA-887 / DSM 12427 / ZAS-2) TaxID=545694 RepID=F5YJD8_TREPZ|nr:hypothetical protein TREPR_0751 [Treponema primitia ZAS-2]
MNIRNTANVLTMALAKKLFLIGFSFNLGVGLSVGAAPYEEAIERFGP